MEDELKCPACRKFLEEPVLLQCWHSYCRECAIRAFQKTTTPSLPCSISSGVSDTVSLCVSDPDQESDKLSVISESDSGIFGAANANTPGSNSACSSRGSRPSSFLGQASHSQTTQHQNSRTLILPSSGFTITCDTCQKNSFYVDENQLAKQPVNLALQRLIKRYKRAKTPLADAPCSSNENFPPDCKFCEENARPVTLYCDSCGFFFCDPCKPVVHPFRGPLKEHTIVPASPNIARKSFELGPVEPTKDYICEQHTDEFLTMYCLVCNTAICCKCINSTKHNNHNVQSLATTVKTHKGELSKLLTNLSGKAKKAHENINQLKQLQDQINVNCDSFKKNLSSQVDALIRSIEERRRKLLEFVDMERDNKRQILRDQITRSSNHLTKTTGLIQFCIEILKETDPVAYLQIGNGLCNRTTNSEFLWNKQMNTKPEVNDEFVLNLDTQFLQQAIDSLEFVQLKAPCRPFFVASDCLAENNSVVLAWSCLNNGTAIDGFILELDSGRDDGKVPRNTVCTCTIDGLHFDTLYNARLRSFNSVGQSPFSDPICLQTAQVAWFQLMSQTDMLVTNDCRTVTGTTLDFHVCFGTVSLSKGVHYWEVTIDRIDVNTDIVIGVAQQAG
ncbi:hypothetical protein M3Y97_00036800 [Aphelenchoides bicaudatus]|nr:hypothetical protein M3Y97_00036800 [Aphelenchoides bicaudatus]